MVSATVAIFESSQLTLASVEVQGKKLRENGSLLWTLRELLALVKVRRSSWVGLGPGFHYLLQLCKEASLDRRWDWLCDVVGSNSGGRGVAFDQTLELRKEGLHDTGQFRRLDATGLTLRKR